MDEFWVINRGRAAGREIGMFQSVLADPVLCCPDSR